MKNRILLIIPSRRPAALLSALGSVLSTSCGYTDVLVVRDQGEDSRLIVSCGKPRIHTIVIPRRPMLQALNNCIMESLNDYEIFGFIGDDILMQTAGWDYTVYQLLRNNYGVVYGDDGIQHENLPTHPFFSGLIPRTLGYAVPPNFRHYYFDNYLKALATELGCLHYCSKILTTHKHHSVTGGLPYDDVYRQAEVFYESDRLAFEDYKLTLLTRDVERVRTYVTDVGIEALKGSPRTLLSRSHEQAPSL